ncbi:MAG: hypothetical protein ABWY36_06220 [Leifsonia sp.]
MSYYVGDIPAQALVVEPQKMSSAGVSEPVDLAPFTTVEAKLYGPDGALVAATFTATIDEDVIDITWPTTTPFATAGIYDLRLVLTGTGVRERVPAVRLVADDEDGWHTLDTAREDWRDAPGFDAWLYELLWTAKQDVIAYAPALAEDARPPINYRRAQLMQARNLWNAGKVDPASGGDGDDTFVLRPFPLDWTVKQVLRPKRAIPTVG